MSQRIEAPAFAVCVLLLVGPGAGAMAQPMYRCGNTYSQIPCDKAAEPVRVFQDAKKAPPAGLRGKELCKASVPASMNLKDPYSAKVETLGAPTPEVIKYAEEPIVAKRYDVAMNAKNSYGAYTGIKVYFCYLSDDEMRLLRVDAPKE